MSNFNNPKNYNEFMDAMENMEISGQPEHNARVRENRNLQFQKHENEKLRNEISNINQSLQKQIDEAKKSSKRSELISWISVGIAAASLLVAFIALFK